MSGQQFIDRVRALDNAATEGPWGVDGAAHPGPDDTLVVYPKEDGGAVAYVQPSWDDAEFIAAARTMLPAAVEALARVRELHRKSTAVRTLPRQLRKDQADGEPHHCCTYCAEVWPCETYEATEVDA